MVLLEIDGFSQAEASEILGDGKSSGGPNFDGNFVSTVSGDISEEFIVEFVRVLFRTEFREIMEVTPSELNKLIK